MIIASVRSAAVPEEGKPYRKIKVSSDVVSTFPPNVIKDAVSAYIKDKVSHILRGDCVVEVHWNGIDIKTLHLRSIQPLSPDEVLQQRNSEAACRKKEEHSSRTAGRGPSSKAANQLPTASSSATELSSSPSSLPTSLPPSLPVTSSTSVPTSLATTLSTPMSTPMPTALPTPMPTAVPTPMPTALPTRMPTTVPTSLAATPTPSVSATILPSRPPEAQKTLRVVAVKGNFAAKQNVPAAAGSVLNVNNSVPQVRHGVSFLPSSVMVTGINGNLQSQTATMRNAPVRQIVSASGPAMIARNTVRMIVPTTSTTTLSITPPQFVSRLPAPRPPLIRTPFRATVREPIVRVSRLVRSGLPVPQTSRLVRLRAHPPKGPVLIRIPTPVGDITPSNSQKITASLSNPEKQVVAQPTIVPMQPSHTPFSVLPAAQQLLQRHEHQQQQQRHQQQQQLQRQQQLQQLEQQQQLRLEQYRQQQQRHQQQLLQHQQLQAQQQLQQQQQLLQQQQQQQQAPTIAPVMTVRQIAASSPNLSVRVNGSVIRAVPGQVIRRVTGEIVRVLDNGSLEPVDVRVTAKPIVTSRDKPISVDSDSDSSSDDTSTESDFEVTRAEVETTEHGAHSKLSTVRSGDLIRKIKARCQRIAQNLSYRSPPTEAQQTIETSVLSRVQRSPELFDPTLLTPHVDFSEGSPYNEMSIQELTKQSEEPVVASSGCQSPDLVHALVVTHDGEVRLDPDLFEDYFNSLAVKIGLMSPRRRDDDMSYLFHQKPKPKSQCPPCTPVLKKDSLASANIARNIYTDSDSDSESDSDSKSSDSDSSKEKDSEPEEKKIKLDETARRCRTYSRADALMLAPVESPEESSQDRVRSKWKPSIRMTHSGNTAKVVSRSRQDSSQDDLEPRTLHFYKGVKLSEPIKCFEAFVVMDKLKTQTRRTVYLNGFSKKRSVEDLFENQKEDLFFDLSVCCVNPRAKRTFDNLPNPLRPINDPNRGKVVSRMAMHGIPIEPTCSKSVEITFDRPENSDVRNSSKQNVVDVGQSKNDVSDLDSVYVQIIGRHANLDDVPSDV